MTAELCIELRVAGVDPQRGGVECDQLLEGGDDDDVFEPDLNEAAAAQLVDGREARLVVAVGRRPGDTCSAAATSSSAPAVIRKVGLENIVVVAALEKLVALDPPTLRIDTGDPELDAELSGHRSVRIAPNRTLVLRVST